MAGLVPFQRPEAGAVGGQDLIGQYDLAGFIQAELQLGVGNDDPALQRIGGAAFVDGQGQVEIFSSCSPSSAFVEGV